MRSDNEALPDLIDAAAVPRWNEEADVVVGYGMAGACAALEAVNAGADTLIVERFSGHGGTSAVPGGHSISAAERRYRPAGSRMARKRLDIIRRN